MKCLRYQKLYESDMFIVLAIDSRDATQGVEIVYTPPQGGLRTVTYLTGDPLHELADAAADWQANPPPQGEIEEYLAGSMFLGPQYPLNLH